MAKAWQLVGINANHTIGTNAKKILRIRLDEMLSFEPLVRIYKRVVDIHSMRISAKRLRYTMEIFKPCYSDDVYDKYYRVVKEIQTKAGEIQDCEVMILFLKNYIADKKIGRAAINRFISFKRREQRELIKEFVLFLDKLREEKFEEKFLREICKI